MTCHAGPHSLSPEWTMNPIHQHQSTMNAEISASGKAQTSTITPAQPTSHPDRLSPGLTYRLRVFVLAVVVPAAAVCVPGPGANRFKATVGGDITRVNWDWYWRTSVPSGSFQILQRREPGWVNRGTNGENECPELPTGTTIRTAYGPYAAAWREVAERLETPPSAELRTAM
jgi:hypothetical protein